MSEENRQLRLQNMHLNHYVSELNLEAKELNWKIFNFETPFLDLLLRFIVVIIVVLLLYYIGYYKDTPFCCFSFCILVKWGETTS